MLLTERRNNQPRAAATATRVTATHVMWAEVGPASRGTGGCGGAPTSRRRRQLPAGRTGKWMDSCTEAQCREVEAEYGMATSTRTRPSCGTTLFSSDSNCKRTQKMEVAHRAIELNQLEEEKLCMLSSTFLDFNSVGCGWKHLSPYFGKCI